MTIAELREILANYPQDLPVMVDGYEGGYDDAAGDRIATREIQLAVNKEWFYGRHDAPGEPEPPSNLNGNYIPVYTIYLETDGNRNASLANV